MKNEDTMTDEQPQRVQLPSLTAEDNSTGGWNYTALWCVRKTALRVRLHRDTYMFQSHFAIDFLTKEGWKELHALHAAESNSQPHTSYGKPFPLPDCLDAATADEAALLDVACALLATLKARKEPA